MMRCIEGGDKRAETIRGKIKRHHEPDREQATALVLHNVFNGFAGSFVSVGRHHVRKQIEKLVLKIMNRNIRYECEKKNHTGKNSEKKTKCNCLCAHRQSAFHHCLPEKPSHIMQR